MKVALITDTHWGVRNDNAAFHDNAKRFLDNVFFPTLLRDGISHVWHLGDLVDRRKYINFLTAKRLREDFLEQLWHNDIEMKIIAGNHDVFYKNTNSVNALDEIVARKYDVEIHTRPAEIDADGTKVLFLPWINDENREESLYAINNTKAAVVMGHLELSGFHMYRGSPVSHGDSPDLFGRFDLVCSGHYHHRSSSGNIRYLGSPGQFTWSDYDDPRGFHVFDTETKELTFVENPYTMFDKVWYDDRGKESKDILEFDVEKYRSKILKVIVTAKTNPYWFDTFIDRLEKVSPLEIQIVEDHLNLNLESDDSIIDEAESTVEIFKKQIQQIDAAGIDKNTLEKTMVELYTEALAVE